VRLFGLEVPDGGATDFTLGALHFSSWAIADGRLTTAIRCGTVNLALRARLPIAPDSFETFRLSDSLAAETLPGAATFYVEIGGLRLAFPTPPMPPAGATLGFAIGNPNQQEWPRFSSHPIELLPQGAIELDFSDPSKPRLLLLAGAFEATASVLTTRDGTKRRFFSQTYRSAGAPIALLQPHSGIDVAFQVPAKAPLPLYGETVGEDLALGMGLSGCSLHATVAVVHDRPNRVVRLWAETPQPGASLTTYGLADATNAPARWRLAGNGVDLSCRSSTLGRPATLMFAALVEAPCAGRSVSGVSLAQEGTAPLHGLLPDGEFRLHGATASLVCDQREPFGAHRFQPAADDPLAPCMLTELTLPWARFPRDGGPTPEFRYPKPGLSYQPTAGHGPEVEIIALGRAGLGLPLLGNEWLGPADTVRQTALAKPITALTNALNQQSHNLFYTPRQSTHETLFIETPVSAAPLHPERLFEFLPSGESERPDLTTFAARLGFSLVQVDVSWRGRPPNYLLLRSGVNGLTDYSALKQCLGDFALDVPAAPAGRSFGLLKLSHELTLADIWRIEAGHLPDIQAVLHASLEGKTWTGLLLFDLPVDCSAAQQYKVLRSIIPPGIHLKYLAITARREGDGRASVCGRIRWQNQGGLAAPIGPEFEVNSRAISLDIAWYDGALTYFQSKTELQFGSLLGRSLAAPTTFVIEGSFDQATRSLRFAGVFSRPVDILPEPFGPIEKLQVKSATIERVDDNNAVSLDGSLALRDFQTASFAFTRGAPIDFKGLRIVLPDGVQMAGNWLRILYSTISIPVSLPAMEAQGFSLHLDWIAVDWAPGIADRWSSFFQLDLGNLPSPSVVLGLRVDLMKLPHLALKGLDRLILNLALGFGAGGSPRLGLSFADFGASIDRLQLDLLRFLVLTVEGVEKFSNVDGTAKGLMLKSVSLRVLEQPIVTNLELIVFSTAQQRHGFLGLLPEPGGLGGLLDVHWLLVAQNLTLPVDVVNRILEIDPVDAAGPPDAAQPAAACETVADARTKAERLHTAINALKATVTSGALAASTIEVEEWTFAAGFTLLDLLQGKALFQDGRYYGLTLDGPIFCDWFGYRFALAVLYIQGRTPSEDEFSLTLRVPRVTLPAFEFIGGIIHLQVRMDGSFLIDIGFPWIEGGVRRWDRALGAIVTPFQGSGGFYLRKQGVVSIEQVAGHKGLRVGGGLALQLGLGGAYGDTLFRVSASIGIFIVVEGEALLCDDRLIALQLIGSVGILGRASGELNWWIISIRVEVLLIAEARLTFTWGKLMLPPAGTRCEAEGGATIAFQLTVYAAASASACIGWGPFKICAGISVSIPIPLSPEIKLRA
jgi:hypothetical protein